MLPFVVQVLEPAVTTMNCLNWPGMNISAEMTLLLCTPDKLLSK